MKRVQLQHSHFVGHLWGHFGSPGVHSHCCGHHQSHFLSHSGCVPYPVHGDPIVNVPCHEDESQPESTIHQTEQVKAKDGHCDQNHAAHYAPNHSPTHFSSFPPERSPNPKFRHAQHLALSAYTAWNCWEMEPVLRFKVRPITVECFGEGPKYCPQRDHRVHFGSFLPSCNFGSKTYARQPHTWVQCKWAYERNLLNEKSSIRGRKVVLFSKLFQSQIAYSIAKGHNIKSVFSGQWIHACNNLSLFE